jgi:hypothetical protein
MKREAYRLLIAFGGVAFDFLNRLKLRKMLDDSSPTILKIVSGSLPSFTASFCGYYFLSYFFPSVKTRKKLFLGVGAAVLIQEVQQYFLEPAKIVGRTFDYFDIGFIVLGLVCAYLLDEFSLRVGSLSGDSKHAPKDSFQPNQTGE